MAVVTVRHEALVYDGTNGTEIASTWLADTILVSDTGQELVIQIAGWPPTQYTIPLGYYVLRYYGRTFYQPVSPADYVQNWVEIPAVGGV